ncbi:MAG TPA: mannose-1-phosphate guanylyltransferase [bacterium]|nr:mannose-1-phosphate guanylyltransferase [bacterium]
MRDIYSVVMAGGRGSRFWPRSRKTNSKQTLNIVGRNTMIQDTVNRLVPVNGAEKVLVVTNSLLEGKIRAQLPMLPDGNIIVEPESRGTAPCIGLAAVVIQHISPGATMACFAADHLITDLPRFHSDVIFAAQVASELNVLVAFGVPIKRADPGLGYIQAGDILKTSDDNPARKVARFIEKPDMETALRFAQDPDYFANSGMFVWKADTFLIEVEKHLPDMHAGLMRIASSIGSPTEIKTIADAFRGFKTISVDHGVMEKSDRVAMIPAGFGWNDIGSWDSLYDVWPKDESGNAAIGRTLTIDSSNSLIFSPKKLVTTIGVEDLIIVETDDALLVCKRSDAQKVSGVVEILRGKKWEEYL